MLPSLAQLKAKPPNVYESATCKERTNSIGIDGIAEWATGVYVVDVDANKSSVVSSLKNLCNRYGNAPYLRPGTNSDLVIFSILKWFF